MAKNTLPNPPSDAIGASTFTGLNTIDRPYIIKEGESPYMINMDITSDGTVRCRTGYEKVLDAGLEGGWVGGMPFYRTYGDDQGDYMLLFHSNGNAYSWKYGTTTVTDLGTFSADPGKITQGITFNNQANFGDGTDKYYFYEGGANIVKRGTIPVDVSIFGVYGQRLHVAGNVDAPMADYYCEVDDPNVWSGGTTGTANVNKGDGQKITSLIGNNDAMQILKEDSVHQMNFGFDSTYNITKPQIQPRISSQGGAFAGRSTQPVYGYAYFLSKAGFQLYGYTGQNIAANLPAPLSLNIQPTTNQINFSNKDSICSTFFNDKYVCTAPLGNTTTNLNTFVYNESVKRRFNIDNWVMYNGINAIDYIKFRDDNNKDDLYFISPDESKLFKFNNTYSDNGNGYTRIWRSKTFRFGERTEYEYIDITGSKTKNSKIYVDIRTDDNEVRNIEITDENLLTTASGGYVGGSYSGSSYVGGTDTSGSSEAPLYEFKKRIRIPDSVNMGYQMWFQLRNEEEGAGWEMNSYKLIYKQYTDDPTYGRAD